MDLGEAPRPRRPPEEWGTEEGRKQLGEATLLTPNSEPHL